MVKKYNLIKIFKTHYYNLNVLVEFFEINLEDLNDLKVILILLVYLYLIVESTLTALLCMK